MTDETSQADPTSETVQADLAAAPQVDPAKAEETLTELVILDHKLRDHGSSLASLLSSFARSSAGIRGL